MGAKMILLQIGGTLVGVSVVGSLWWVFFGREWFGWEVEDYDQS